MQDFSKSSYAKQGGGTGPAVTSQSPHVQQMLFSSALKQELKLHSRKSSAVYTVSSAQKLHGPTAGSAAAGPGNAGNNTNMVTKSFGGSAAAGGPLKKCKKRQ